MSGPKARSFNIATNSPCLSDLLLKDMNTLQTNLDQFKNGPILMMPGRPRLKWTRLSQAAARIAVWNRSKRSAGWTGETCSSCTSFALDTSVWITSLALTPIPVLCGSLLRSRPSHPTRPGIEVRSGSSSGLALNPNSCRENMFVCSKISDDIIVGLVCLQMDTSSCLSAAARKE